MKQVLILGSLLLGGSPALLAQMIKFANATEFQAKMSAQNAVVIDVRTAEEFQFGRLANAKNVDWYRPDFESQVNQISKNKIVLLYCRSGQRSTEAAVKMESMGFAHVYSLTGGILRWEASGKPVIKTKL